MYIVGVVDLYVVNIFVGFWCRVLFFLGLVVVVEVENFEDCLCEKYSCFFLLVFMLEGLCMVCLGVLLVIGFCILFYLILV